MARLPELDSTRDLHGYSRRAHFSPSSLVETLSPINKSLHAHESRLLSLQDMTSTAAVDRNALPPLYTSTANASPSDSTFVTPTAIPLRRGFSNPLKGLSTLASPVSLPAPSIATSRDEGSSPRQMSDFEHRPSESFSDDFPLTHMRVRSGRVEKPSPRGRPAMLSNRSGPINTVVALPTVESRRSSVFSQTSSCPSDLQRDLHSGEVASNKKAGKERHARLNLQTVIKMHYDTITAAGMQAKTRLNSHNSSVSGIPIKKEEVLELSLHLHEQKDRDMAMMKRRIKDSARIMSERSQRTRETRDLLSKPGVQLDDVRRMLDEVLALEEMGADHSRSLVDYYTPEPTPTPSPEPSFGHQQ